MARAVVRASAMALLLIAAPLLIHGVTSQSADGDPRNTGDYFRAIDNGDCFACHEDFDPVRVTIPRRYSMLPIGEPVDLEVKVRNPWDHGLFDISLKVNADQAPGIDILQEGTIKPPHNETAVPVTLEPGDEAEAYHHVFPVQTGATYIRVRAAVADAGPLGLVQPPEFTLALDGASHVKTLRGVGPHEIVLEGEDASRYGFGDFEALLWYSQPVPPQLVVTLDVEVRYDAAGAKVVTLEAPPETRLQEGDSYTFTVPIIARTEETGLLDFEVLVRAHYDHSGAGVDDGHYKRFTTMQTRGGLAAQLLSTQAPVPVAPSIDIYNLFTRLVGFVALLLVPMAVLSGGALGKGSRRVMNRTLGGAKRRVLWHTSMSWSLIVLATLHLALALYESRSPLIVGVVWGGLGWLLLVSLGFTGLLQTQIIKRWNYRRWRMVHLVPALAVPVFGLMHTVIDGSDLDAVRDWLPWLRDLAVF